MRRTSEKSIFIVTSKVLYERLCRIELMDLGKVTIVAENNMITIDSANPIHVGNSCLLVTNHIN